MSDGHRKLNTTIPNSFPVPNFFIDDLMHLLTDHEWRVLSYMTRHIFGWQDKIAARKRHMSLTMFVEGFDRFHGCGMSRPAVASALESLESYGVIKKAGTSKQKGNLWLIPETDADVQYEALKQRYEDNASKGRAKTDKAAKASAAKRKKDGTTDVLSEMVRPTYHERYDPRTIDGTTDVPNQSQAQSQAQSQLNLSKDKLELSHENPNLHIVDKPKRQKKQAHPLFKDMQAAIQAAFKWETPAQEEWAILGKAANSLLNAGLTIEQLPSLVGFCRGQWREKLRPHHLAINVSEWRKTQPKPAPVPVDLPPFGEDSHFASLEEQTIAVDSVIDDIIAKMNAPREKRTA